MTFTQKQKDQRTKNTEILINNLVNNDDQFAMLKGVLCAYHGLDQDQVDLFRSLFDTRAIAARMDYLQRLAMASDNIKEVNAAPAAVQEQDQAPVTPAQHERAAGRVWNK